MGIWWLAFLFANEAKLLNPSGDSVPDLFEFFEGLREVAVILLFAPFSI